MTGPKVIQLELGPMMNYVYLVIDPESKVAAVVDPSWHAPAIEEAAVKQGAKITHLLLTHSHFDHSNAVAALMKRFNAKLYIHYEEAGETEVDDKTRIEKIEDGSTIRLGSLKFKVLHTPGHTRGSVCFVGEGCVFTGDTLFVDGIGRADLPGGDADMMFKSLNKIKNLPDNTIVYPGHNYGGSPNSTISSQKRTNPYLGLKSAGDFLRMV